MSSVAGRLGPLFAIALAFAGTSDWQLVASRDGVPVETMGAKSEADCRVAVAAFERGWFARDLAGARAICLPAPNCFSPESLVTRGFNDAGGR